MGKMMTNEPATEIPLKIKNLFKKVIKQTLVPPEQMLVSEWAEKYRVLDESSNISRR